LTTVTDDEGALEMLAFVATTDAVYATPPLRVPLAMEHDVPDEVEQVYELVPSVTVAV
jgi:hypothetical protein